MRAGAPLLSCQASTRAERVAVSSGYEVVVTGDAGATARAAVGPRAVVDVGEQVVDVGAVGVVVLVAVVHADGELARAQSDHGPVGPAIWPGAGGAAKV